MVAQPKQKVLISACLLGERVRYDGRAKALRDEILRRWQEEGRIVRICPEVAGGLPVPRPVAEIQGPGGLEVLAGEAAVRSADGVELSEAFVAGARAALALAQLHGVQVALLKERSPSCGSQWIYDGSFSGELRQGQGVSAALLREHGIQVFGEGEIEAADRCLRALEAR